MATASTAAIAIPSDVHAFATSVSPRGVDLEGRLDLSLDALIKERKKEHKLLRKEEAKKLKQKPQSADKRKAPKQQKPQQQKQQQATAKGGQKAQRKALVNKNRGLSTLPTAAKDKAAQGKTKTSIAATTAKLRRQMRADKTKTSRLVVSPKALKGIKQSSTAQQSKKKKNAPQQARKVMPLTQPKSGKKQQVVKQQPNSQVKAPVRQVMRANNKKAKLSITITAQATKKSQKKQKAANKVVLPGKLSQTLVKKASAAKKVVKRAKNRKAAATKVVRQVSGQRKKN
ncbi:hypothetical protein PRIC1_000679 [Phytophthora ramorum]|uniref:Uncharacterized protein n=1 Tax=Phytophthora ramorum TaxID=164328 RepID=H3HAW1_PHYRM|nr:hypothetical protein KRP23_7348 [Phytophthora ramorum]